MAPKTKMAAKSRKPSSQIASNNFQADFALKNFEGTEIKMMAAALHKSDLNVYFQCVSSQTLIRYITHAYHSAVFDKDSDTLSFKLVNDSTETLTHSRFVSLLGGHEGIPESELPPVYEPYPSDEELSSFLEETGYEDSPPPLGDLKKAKFPAPWHMAVHFVLRCLSGKTGGTDAIHKNILRLLWGVYYNRNINFEDILWSDFKQYVLAKKTEVPSARFWAVLLNKIYATHSGIVPEDNEPLFKPTRTTKFSTNPNCPPSKRRLPLHLLTEVGTHRSVVRNYHRAHTDLLPAIADVGTITVEPTASKEHASEEEEDPEVSPLRKKSKSVTFKSPTKSHTTRGKNAQPSIILSRTFHNCTLAP